MSVRILSYIDYSAVDSMSAGSTASTGGTTSNPSATGETLDSGQTFREKLAQAQIAVDLMSADAAIAAAKANGQSGLELNSQLINTIGSSSQIFSDKINQAVAESQNEAEDSASFSDSSSDKAAQSVTANGSTSGSTGSVSPDGVYNTSTSATNIGTSASSLTGSLACSDDLNAIFDQAAATYNVDVKLLKSVALAESGFNVNATSSSGAQGVMQLMPIACEDLGVSDAYDPTQNIMGGAKLLARLLSKYNGDTEKAVAAYNAGSGNVDKYGGVPPFTETQNYVKKVLGYYQS